MDMIIKQPHTDTSKQLASPEEGSAIRTRKLQNTFTAKMVRGLRFARLNAFVNQI